MGRSFCERAAPNWCFLVAFKDVSEVVACIVHDACRACVCTPPCCVTAAVRGGTYVCVCQSLAVTSSTRQLEWHGVLVINRFVIVLSCDCDSIIEANNSDRATSDADKRKDTGETAHAFPGHLLQRRNRKRNNQLIAIPRFRSTLSTLTQSLTKTVCLTVQKETTTIINEEQFRKCPPKDKLLTET